MQRPQLHAYKVRSVGSMTVETYRSDAGEMRAYSSRHRITLNRTAHHHYAHRFGDRGQTRTVDRSLHMLGFEPADTCLWVDGDAAEYVSIFQETNDYRSLPDRPCARLEERAFIRPADPDALAVVLALARIATSDKAPEPLLVEQLSLALASAVLRLGDARHLAIWPVSSPLSASRLRQVLACIDQRLSDPLLHLQDLAEVAGLSPFHFARLFKAATGAPPHRFIVMRRLERAKMLIRDSRQSLAEIALATGFVDQPHLSNAFRRELGTTPGRYRRDL